MHPLIDNEWVSKEKFIVDFEKQMEDFKGHRSRVQTQYQQIRELKDKIARNEIIVQLDFAENYSCRSVEEVQSAYFNQTSVTLHPMVAYFKDENNTLQHQSYIVVSDELINYNKYKNKRWKWNTNYHT